MTQTIYLSAECPGLPLGLQRFAGHELNFKLLPIGLSLAERIDLCSAQERASAIAVVSLLTDVLDAKQLNAVHTRLPQLRLIANYAVGFNNIAVAAARERGLAVTNTPHVLGDATADLTLALLLMVSRRIWPSALELHNNGRFPGWSPQYGLGVDLKGRTLGIVGFGDIGRRVAARAEAFGLRVVTLQSQRSTPSSTLAYPRLSEDEFLAATDVLSFHCPLTPQTRGWLSAQRIAKMKRGAIVINTARGEVIDESALASALRGGHLYGAGLDVFCGEPIVSDTLRDVPHLLILPHLGSATVETRSAMGQRVLDNILALLDKREPLPTQVNA